MAQGGACIGPCNARWREAQEAFTAALAAYDPLDPAQERPLPPEIRAWPGDPTWCSRCASRIRQCLAELDEVACILQASADGLRGDAGDSGRVSGSREARSPSPAGDDVEELADMLTSWEGSYRQIREWPSPPRRGFLASVVTSTVAWLIVHLDGILACEDIAGDFGSEVMTWHREFVGKSKAGARKLRKPLRCPGCRLLMLTWTEGEKYVKCGNADCNRLLSLSEYEIEVTRRAGMSAAENAAEQEVA